MDAAKIEAQFAALHAKLDMVLDQNHQLLAQLQRVSIPVDVVTTEEAAQRAGVSTRTIERLAAEQVFTDGRPPEKRGTCSPRRFYADECVVYRSEGRTGVRRLRETQARN